MNIVTRLMQSSEERRTRRVHRGPCWTLQEFADSVGAKRQALTGQNDLEQAKLESFISGGTTLPTRKAANES